MYVLCDIFSPRKIFKKGGMFNFIRCLSALQPTVRVWSEKFYCCDYKEIFSYTIYERCNIQHVNIVTVLSCRFTHINSQTDVLLCYSFFCQSAEKPRIFYTL